MNVSVLRRSLVRRLAVLAVSLAALIAPTSASGGVLGDTALSCVGYERERPFLPWLDPAEYVLAPNGGFETGASEWKLAGGARVAAGNEPYYVRVGGADDASSLVLPAGSSATSSAMCVGAADLTLRFFVQANALPLFSSLKVEVVYEDASGQVRAATLAHVPPGRWGPTLPILALRNITNLLSLDGLTTAVAFRFTPVGAAATWRIDDVYVDPFLWK